MAKLCLGCMKLKNNSPVCEHCGYNENVPNYSHQLPVGTVLKGQYTVGKVLGQGGFCITYIGWDTVLGVPVAIKEHYPSNANRDCTVSLAVVYPNQETEESLCYVRDWFRQDGRTKIRLQNIPGIAHVHDLFQENNTDYIIMDYLEGIDLHRHIHVLGHPLSVRETLTLFLPVMEAIHQIHKKGLILLDISPESILLLRDSSSKLLIPDSYMDMKSVGTKLQHANPLMRRGYSPIELVVDHVYGNIGPWTDVYSLCATIYYCLTGTVPADTPERMIEQTEVNWNAIPGLTAGQAEAFSRGMAIMPRDRTSSILQLIREIYGTSANTPEMPVDNSRKNLLHYLKSFISNRS